MTTQTVTPSTYVVDDHWAKLPTGWTIGDVGGVAVDANDNVFVFNRSDHPLMVFDREGNLLRSMGEGLFTRPHGIDIGDDGAIYLTDDGDHSVRKFDADGRLLLQLGIPGRPSPAMSGMPFNRCTHTALSPGGDIYVADGYGNAKVHKYDAGGRLLHSWGEPGSGPGQFRVVHNICCDKEGWIRVADRENHRVQVFRPDGRFESQWGDLHRPCGLTMDRNGDGAYYVTELADIRLDAISPPPRFSKLDSTGALLSRYCDHDSTIGGGTLFAPHAIAVDSRGDVYIGEVPERSWSLRYPGKPMPTAMASLKKLRRTAA